MSKLCFSLLFLLSFYATFGQPVTDSIRIEGIYRSFSFDQPSPNLKSPSLMFAIHGSGGNAVNFMRNAERLRDRATDENVIVVFPQGYLNYWNECRKASTVEANKIDINEEAFFAGMIDYFVQKYGANRSRVFASGFSGGGQMAYKMGIRLPKVFKGIAAMVANMPTPDNMDCAESGQPVATLIINGTADPVNPNEGGEMKSAGLTLGTVLSTDQSFAYWSKLAGYKGKPVKTILPDAVPDNNVTAEQYSFKKKKTPEITLIKVINGVHSFPKDIDFFETAWEFFKRQLLSE